MVMFGVYLKNLVLVKYFMPKRTLCSISPQKMW